MLFDRYSKLIKVVPETPEILLESCNVESTKMRELIIQKQRIITLIPLIHEEQYPTAYIPHRRELFSSLHLHPDFSSETVMPQQLQFITFLVSFIKSHPDLITKALELQFNDTHNKLFVFMCYSVIPAFFGFFSSSEHISHGFSFYCSLVSLSTNERIIDQALVPFFCNSCTYRFTEMIYYQFGIKFCHDRRLETKQIQKDILRTIYTAPLIDSIIQSYPLIPQTHKFLLKYMISNGRNPKSVLHFFLHRFAFPQLLRYFKRTSFTSHFIQLKTLMMSLRDDITPCLRIIDIFDSPSLFEVPSMFTVFGAQFTQLLLTSADVHVMMVALESVCELPVCLRSFRETSYFSGIKYTPFWVKAFSRCPRPPDSAFNWRSVVFAPRLCPEVADEEEAGERECEGRARRVTLRPAASDARKDGEEEVGGSKSSQRAACNGAGAREGDGAKASDARKDGEEEVGGSKSSQRAACNGAGAAQCGAREGDGAKASDASEASKSAVADCRPAGKSSSDTVLSSARRPVFKDGGQQPPAAGPRASALKRHSSYSGAPTFNYSYLDDGSDSSSDDDVPSPGGQFERMRLEVASLCFEEGVRPVSFLLDDRPRTPTLHAYRQHIASLLDASSLSSFVDYSLRRDVKDLVSRTKSFELYLVHSLSLQAMVSYGSIVADTYTTMVLPIVHNNMANFLKRRINPTVESIQKAIKESLDGIDDPPVVVVQTLFMMAVQSCINSIVPSNLLKKLNSFEKVWETHLTEKNQKVVDNLPEVFTKKPLLRSKLKEAIEHLKCLKTVKFEWSLNLIIHSIALLDEMIRCENSDNAVILFALVSCRNVGFMSRFILLSIFVVKQNSFVVMENESRDTYLWSRLESAIMKLMAPNVELLTTFVKIQDELSKYKIV